MGLFARFTRRKQAKRPSYLQFVTKQRKAMIDGKITIPQFKKRMAKFRERNIKQFKKKKRR